MFFDTIAAPQHFFDHPPPPHSILTRAQRLFFVVSLQIICLLYTTHFNTEPVVINSLTLLVCSQFHLYRNTFKEWEFSDRLLRQHSLSWSKGTRDLATIVSGALGRSFGFFLPIVFCGRSDHVSCFPLNVDLLKIFKILSSSPLRLQNLQESPNLPCTVHPAVVPVFQHSQCTLPTVLISVLVY